MTYCHQLFIDSQASKDLAAGCLAETRFHAFYKAVWRVFDFIGVEGEE